MVWTAFVTANALRPAVGAPIPAFARKYRTACSTCHTAAPKLNVLGEAFRLNGYHFPENDRLLRKDEPVPLGEDPWKDLWPRAIWPGEVSGSAPLALRVQNDVAVVRENAGGYRYSYRFPNDVDLLAGATLGETIAAFLEAGWNRQDGLKVAQAKLMFQDLLPFVSHRLVNLWLGVQNLYLSTFGADPIDQAGRQPFLWQDFSVSDLAARSRLTGEALVSGDRFTLALPQPVVELNGLVGKRFSYGAGLAQGAGEATDDNNRHKDFYYKARYKIGGLGLDGTYDRGGGPLPGGHGQLLDRSLTLEHFSYFGAEPVGADRDDAHRAVGLTARALYGPWDAGLGYVWSRHDDPWGNGAKDGVEYASAFGKVEYLIFPWLIGSLKFDVLDVTVRPPALPAGFVVASHDQTRLVPGLVFLVRQNVRGVAESEFFVKHDPASVLNEARPWRLWLRLDAAF